MIKIFIIYYLFILFDKFLVINERKNVYILNVYLFLLVIIKMMLLVSGVFINFVISIGYICGFILFLC